MASHLPSHLRFRSTRRTTRASSPSAFFDAGSTMKFTPMVFNGTTYDPMTATVVDSPYEGDSVLSPSAAPGGEPPGRHRRQGAGYVLRRVRATRFGQSYQVAIDQKLATICMPGAKANVSFDERFMVTHHYHDAAGATHFAGTCAACHGADGHGSDFAPDLRERVPARDDPALVRALLTGKGAMPSWADRFDDGALADLLAFLRERFGSP